MKMLTIYSTVMDLLTQRTNEHDVGISKRTLACDYIPSVRLFNKFLGRTATVHDLQTKTFNEFRNWLIDASGNANRTQVGRLTSIKMLMNYAINEGLIDRQYKFKSIRIVRKNPTSWGSEEVSKLITAAMQSSTARNLLGDTGIEKGLYFATSIAVGWDTALRRGDVLALKFEDIVMQKDSFGSVVILQSKTQNLIKCELKPDTIQFLQQIRSQGDKARANIWPTISNREMDSYMQKLCKEAGVEGTYRYLRRGAVTIAENVGGIGMGSKLAGHMNRATTVNHYIDQHRLDAPSVALPRVIDSKFILKSVNPTTIRALKCEGNNSREFMEAAKVETLSICCSERTDTTKLTEEQLDAIIEQDGGDCIYECHDFLAEITRSGNIVLVARIDGKIVGVARSYVSKNQEDSGVLSADGESWIDVHPNYRRQGIGSQLINALLQARSKAAKKQQKGEPINRYLTCFLDINGSPWAKKFMQATGFKTYWVLPKDRPFEGYLIRKRA